MSATPSPLPSDSVHGSGSTSTRVLTVSEIARELRCSKAHVHNIIAGRVPGLTAMPTLSLGRRRLVRRASFEAWMEANEHALQRSV